MNTPGDNRGFDYAPSIADVQPTEAEQDLARQLWQWLEDSKRSRIEFPQRHSAEVWDFLKELSVFESRPARRILVK